MSSDMKNTKLVTVMTYGSSHVAHAAKGLLAQNGIVAEVQGAALADAFSWYGSAVRKIDLVTFEADAERALSIIKKMEQEATRPTGPWSDGETLWLCECEEQNAHSFDHCWKCGLVRPENPQTVPVPRDHDNQTFETENSVRAPIEADDSPYRTPTSGAVTTKTGGTSESEENRALKVALISVIFFPLGFYGAYLCLRCFGEGKMNWKTAGAFLLCLFTCAMTLMVFVG